MRRFRLKALGVVCLSLAAGCLDLVPVEPPGAYPAVLHLTLRVSDDAANRPDGSVPIRVTAVLTPGVNRTGRLQPVTDPILGIAGLDLVPVETRSRGVRSYTADVPVPVESLFSVPLTIRPPRLEDLPDQTISITWPVLWREGEAMVALPPGADLHLHVGRSPVGGPPYPSIQRWSMAIFHGTGWASLGHDELAPDVLNVPAALFGPPGTSALAILSSNQSAELVVSPGEYLLRLELSQAVRWTVNVAGSE